MVFRPGAGEESVRILRLYAFSDLVEGPVGSSPVSSLMRFDTPKSLRISPDSIFRKPYLDEHSTLLPWTLTRSNRPSRQKGLKKGSPARRHSPLPESTRFTRVSSPITATPTASKFTVASWAASSKLFLPIVDRTGRKITSYGTFPHRARPASLHPPVKCRISHLRYPRC